jgi:hypothetical protein
VQEGRPTTERWHHQCTHPPYFPNRRSCNHRVRLLPHLTSAHSLTWHFSAFGNFVFSVRFPDMYPGGRSSAAMAWNMVLPKLYAFSMMWTLNARHRIRTELNSSGTSAFTATNPSQHTVVVRACHYSCLCSYGLGLWPGRRWAGDRRREGEDEYRGPCLYRFPSFRSICRCSPILPGDQSRTSEAPRESLVRMFRKKIAPRWMRWIGKDLKSWFSLARGMQAPRNTFSVDGGAEDGERSGELIFARPGNADRG